MKRYFFDYNNSGIEAIDEEGQEISSFDEVRVEALMALPDLVRMKLPDGQSFNLCMTVRDSAGTKVYRATLVFNEETFVADR